MRVELRPTAAILEAAAAPHLTASSMKPLAIEMLAAAWAHTLPGKESCERDSVSALDSFADLSRTSPEVRDRAYLITSSAHKRE